MEEKKSIHCTLTDHELAAKADHIIDELIKSGGKSFTMQVPARPNADTDLILSELFNRFKRMITQPGAAWVKASDRLPGKHIDVIVRNIKTRRVKLTQNYGHNTGWDVSMDREFMWDNTEWLDESGTPAAGREEDWISVEDRLPEEGGRYWCYVEEITDLGRGVFPVELCL